MGAGPISPDGAEEQEPSAQVRYWKIAPGKGAWNWEASRDGGFIAIGWDELGDLSVLSKGEFEARRDEVVASHDDWTSVGMNQAWTFAHVIREGDRVVANRGIHEVLGIGTVAGPYYFVPGIRHSHRLPVRWDDLTTRRVHKGGWRRTLVELDRREFEEIAGAVPVGEELNIWWVNQGQTLDAERAGGYLWAPLTSKDGRSMYHWDTLSELKEDDIVLHNAHGHLRYVSQVTAPAVMAKRPHGIESDEWEEAGRLVRVDYHELRPPIALETFSQALSRLRIMQGPIDSTGRPKQGYLFRFTPEALRLVRQSQPDTIWPDFVEHGVGTAPPNHSWLQGPDHEEWLRQALRRFQGSQEDYPQKAVDRAARHEYFAKAFSPQILERLPKEGFSELLHEFLYDHRRVGMTGAWRRTLEDDSEHVRQVVVSVLARVSSGDPVAQVVDEALGEFTFRAILFVSCILHDSDWNRYAIFFPTVWKRMQAIGIWSETQPGLTTGETYQLACAIQRGFAAHFELENLDRVDDFLWWAVAETHLHYTPEPPPVPNFDPDTRSIRGDLRMADDPIHQLITVINTGRQALICGPPGTGKTTIAQNAAKEAQRSGFCSGFLMTTATSDWTTFDTVGGYMPAKETGALEFTEGMFLRAIRENRWLIVDELNRADIDKAFGQLFTTLSGQDLELPFRTDSGLPLRIRIDRDRIESSYDEDSATYWVGRNWRVIATMNTFDKNALFTMSFAFMRRFAFVEVGIPGRDVMETLIDEAGVPSRAAQDVKELLDISPRRLGPAIVLDILGYIVERDHSNALVEALRAYVLPQFEGLETPKLYEFYGKMASLLSDSQAQEDLKQYMAEFFELDKERMGAPSLDTDDAEEAEQNLD